MATDFVLAGETWTQPTGATVSEVGASGGGGGGGGNLGGGGSSAGFATVLNPTTSDGSTYFSPGVGTGGAGGDGVGDDGQPGSDTTFSDDTSSGFLASGCFGGQDGLNGGQGGGTDTSTTNFGAPDFGVLWPGSGGAPADGAGGGAGGGVGTINGGSNAGGRGTNQEGAFDGDGNPSGGNGAALGSGDDGDSAYGSGGGGGGGDVGDSGGSGGDGLGFVTYTPPITNISISSDGLTITGTIPDNGGGSGDGTGFTVTPSDYISGFPAITVTAAVASGTTLTLTLATPLLFWYASQTVTLGYDGSGISGVSAFTATAVDISALSEYKPVIAHVVASACTIQKFVFVTSLDSTFSASLNMWFSGVPASPSANTTPFQVVRATYETSNPTIAISAGTYDFVIAFQQQADAFQSDPVSVTLSADPPFGAPSTITVYQNGNPIVMTWTVNHAAWQSSDGAGVFNWTFEWGAQAGGIAYDSDTFYLDWGGNGISEYGNLVTFTGGVPSFTSGGPWDGAWRDLNNWDFSVTIPPRGFAPLGAISIFSATPTMTLANTTITMLLTESGNAFSAVNSGSDFTFTGVADPTGITITLPQGSGTMTLAGAGLDAATDVSYDGSLTILDGDGNEFAVFLNVPLAEAPPPPPAGDDAEGGRIPSTNFEPWKAWL